MEAVTISGKDPAIHVANRPASLRFRQQALRDLGGNLQLPVLDRLLNILRTLISPFFFIQATRYYENDELSRLPALNGHAALRVESYDGISAVPDEVADYVEPLPGEAISVLYVGRQLVGFVRAAFKEIYSPETEQSVNLSAGEVYLYDTYLSPEYQNISLYSYLLASAARSFLQEGFARILIGVSNDNPLYQKAIEKAGFKIFKIQTTYRILWKRMQKTISAYGGSRAHKRRGL